MATVHRAFYIWLCLLVFAILLVLRLDDRIQWHWPWVLFPMWCLDLVAVLATSVRLVRLLRNRRTDVDSGATSHVKIILSRLLPTDRKVLQELLQLVVVGCKVTFQSMLCVWLDHDDAVRLWQVMVPFWLGTCLVLTQLTVRLRRIWTGGGGD